MKKVIKTASGTVSLSTYAATWRAVKNAPPGAEYKSSLCDRSPSTREEILSQFAFGLHDRINRHIPGFWKGRKRSGDYYSSLLRDARRLQEIARRVRIYQFETAEVRRRFGHLLAAYSD